MEAIERITKTKNYDAYFIFDADNILDKTTFQKWTNHLWMDMTLELVID